MHDEGLERGGDRLGHRGHAGREHERAAAGRDREPAGDAPAGRDRADRAAGRRHQRGAVGRDAVAVARVQARVALLQRELEAGLDGARGRGGDGEAVRVHGARVAREVDHADHRAGVRVVDRRGAAGPALDRVAEVLGAEDLDRVVERDRGADRVGARAALAPQRALGEVHVARRAQAHLRGALDRHQHAVGVRDDDQVARLVGDRRQALADQRRDAGERVLLEALVRLRPRRRRSAPCGRPCGSTPGGCERRHESVIASRTSCGSSSSSSAMNRSQAKRNSCARTMGVVPASTASHEFGLTHSTLHAIRRIVEVYG